MPSCKEKQTKVHAMKNNQKYNEKVIKVKYKKPNVLESLSPSLGTTVVSSKEQCKWPKRTAAAAAASSAACAAASACARTLRVFRSARLRRAASSRMASSVSVGEKDTCT